MRVVVCSGRVFYDLDAARRARGLRDVALVRIEELYPFPSSGLRDVLGEYPQAEVVWCQEEPENMGPWRYVDRRLETVLRDIGHASKTVRCVCRPENPSPAPGFKVNYQQAQDTLIASALGESSC